MLQLRDSQKLRDGQGSTVVGVKFLEALEESLDLLVGELGSSLKVRDLRACFPNN